MKIDYERLRTDLLDYYGTAIGSFSIALMDVIEVERVSEEELVEVAQKLKVDLTKYFK